MRRLRQLKLSVKDLLIDPMPSGDIDDGGDFLFSDPELGIALHKELQTIRVREYPGYQTEVAVKRTIDIDGCQVTVHGRIDGMFAGGVIEEFKSTYYPRQLFHQLMADSFHDYWLQTACYRWMFGFIDESEAARDTPDRLTIIDARTKEIRVLHQEFWTTDNFLPWIEERLRKIIMWETERRKFVARQKKMAASIKFPFTEVRAGQKEFMAEIYATCQRRGRLLGQAPTGIGKSLGSLVPALQVALKMGTKVVFLTPKNSQFSVAERAIAQISARTDPGEKKSTRTGKVRALTLGAKSKMCLNHELNCTPTACPYAAGHHDRVRDAGLVQKLAKRNIIAITDLKKIGKKHQVCPYALAMTLLPRRDVVIADYNHAFSPEANLGGKLAGPDIEAPKPVVLIDEAHNLPDRMRDHWSTELSPKDAADTKWSRALARALTPGADGIPDLDRLKKIAEKIRQWLLEHPASTDQSKAALELYFKISGFIEILQIATTSENYFIQNSGAEPNDWRIYCLDGSAPTKEKLNGFVATVAFSATLKPLDFYARELGLDDPEDKNIEWPSPFPPGNQMTIVIPQVSTKWNQRSANESKIADAILRITSLRPGNYIAFFPSFSFLDQIANNIAARISSRGPRSESDIQESDIQESDIQLLLQRPGQGLAETEQMISQLQAPSDEETTILLAVQGGTFSEGVDLPGNQLIGAFIVGPGLPAVSPYREQMRKLYESRYRLGFEYAYTYPGMAKSIQAAGRVIRTASDRGIVVLMDQRFEELRFKETMPEHWQSQMQSARPGESLTENIGNFWTKKESIGSDT